MSDEPEFKKDGLRKVSFFYNVQSNLEQDISGLLRNGIPVQLPTSGFHKDGHCYK